jgi:hypothetical protein
LFGSDPSIRNKGNSKNDDRSAKNANLVGSKLANHGHKENRPKNAVDDFGKDQHEPDGQ